MCIRDRVEPVFAGAAEQIVNVAALWNRKNLKKKSKEIIRLSNENGFCHKRVADVYKRQAPHTENKGAGDSSE